MPRIVWGTVVALILAGTARGADVEDVISLNQPFVGGAAGAGTCTMVMGHPAINSRGQIAVVLNISKPANAPKGDDGTPLPSVQVLALRDAGKFSVLAVTGMPVAGNAQRAFTDISHVHLSEDGSVLFEAELKRPGPRAPGQGANSLWLWRQGKLQMLLATGEPARAGGPIADSWEAVLADEGQVSVLLQVQKPKEARYLVSIKDGAAVLVEPFVETFGRPAGVHYTHLCAAGGYTVVCREQLNNQNTWELCRLTGAGKLEPFARLGEPAPAGAEVRAGQQMVLGRIESLHVSATGRAVMCVQLGTRQNMNIRPAILASEAELGAWRTVALVGGAAPDNRTFSNLATPAKEMAVSDDGHVLFADAGPDKLYYYLADAGGKLEKVMDDARSVWTLNVADGGRALLVFQDSKSNAGYAFDPQRKARLVVDSRTSPAGMGGGKAWLDQSDRRAIYSSELSMKGQWVVVWHLPASPVSSRVSVVDLTK